MSTRSNRLTRSSTLRSRAPGSRQQQAQGSVQPLKGRRPRKPRTGSEGFGACRTVGRDDWGTPEFVTVALAPFDLDPCAWPAARRKHVIAPLCFTKADDGLAKAWPAEDFVWLNPPYGRMTKPFLEKLAQHPAGGIALVFARTDTVWAHSTVFDKASAVLFLKGRLRFINPNGKAATNAAGAPSMLVAYGDLAAIRLQRAVDEGSLQGAVVHLGLQPSALTQTSSV